MAYYNQESHSYGRQGNYQGKRFGDNGDTPTPESVFKQSSFRPQWLSSGADESLPEFAEKMGRYMADNHLTNSKIRSIYGEIKRIQMGEFEKEKASFYLLKPKVAYAYGRDRNNKGLELFKLIFDTAFKNVTDHITYHNFCNLIEAILAYHKAFGGKD